MSPGSRYRILAIDDVRSNLLTIQAILPPEEFVFVGASDAQEAFRILADQSFDLILLDVVLPGIDGYGISQQLKSDPTTSSIPIIFLTALNDEEEIVKGFEAGGVDFISKPFHRAELLIRLRTHLALKDKTEALERVAEDLRQAKQARDRFVSILAHDLKSPFTGFLSLLEEILERPEGLSPEDLQLSLETMEQTAQNVYRLLETLLDWGRSQTGTMVLDRQNQLVSVLVEEALEPLEQAFRKKSIAVVVDVGDLEVFADRSTVVAMFRNLLSNALKFSHSQGRVVVQGRTVGAEAEISVVDQGVGIPLHRIPLLFHLDNKVSTKGTNREPGTGLGLILCAEFAEKNRGTIRVESQPGEGSTFTVVLPAAP